MAFTRQHQTLSIGHSTSKHDDPYEAWFWKKMQEALGSAPKPIYLVNAFKVYGLAKGPVLALSTDNHIKSLQDFMRSPYYATLVPRGANKIHFFGDYADSPELFEFRLGDILMIEEMISFARAQELQFWDPISD
ncbi:hypothetical protein QAD02_000773 [Eretmocerus hayati]|uniref:Uncharacterized protein n=1 Tax=Eretmocerus hayati TaxID=131215 RepID=A0ACC2NGQ7_9HYME|nr:hypothetical protein QAD02_000773 [Eretmocerus hayati]